MLKDRYSYVALLTYEETGISIDFPDLPGCCPCADKDDTAMALKNAKEALGLHIWGLEQDKEPLPAPRPITAFSLKKNQIPALIEVFMPPIRERILDIRSNEEYLAKVARQGAEKARESAAKTLNEVRQIIGFRPY